MFFVYDSCSGAHEMAKNWNINKMTDMGTWSPNTNIRSIQNNPQVYTYLPNPVNSSMFPTNFAGNVSASHMTCAGFDTNSGRLYYYHAAYGVMVYQITGGWNAVENQVLSTTANRTANMSGIMDFVKSWAVPQHQRVSGGGQAKALKFNLVTMVQLHFHMEAFRLLLVTLN